MTLQDKTRTLDDHQLSTLDQLEGDLGAAVDELLRERGIAVRVSSIQLIPLDPPPATTTYDGPIVPEPVTAPSRMPPPGGVYTCWQDTVGGPWICVCGPH